LLAGTAKVPVVYAPMEIIIVRDANGAPIEYRDNRQIRSMRHQLEELNEALLRQQIELDGSAVRQGDQLDSGRAQIQLHRVFNRSDFEAGGRFYGGFWQNMGDRERLGINGQKTVEVDFVAMHIAMLYREADKTMAGDPYDLDRWPRAQAKLAMLIAINAPSGSKAVKALADALRLEGEVSDPFKAATALIAAIKAKHPDIAHAFGSDAGIRLMRQDSEIAGCVMAEMLHATGIVPLSVHDSFITPVTQESKLREAMGGACLPIW
jgi:hypothetical protein